MVELLTSPPAQRLPGSFRDPSGLVFERDGVLLRQVNQGYREHYDRLMRSGLYDDLAAAGLLVAHEEVSDEPWDAGSCYKMLRPERLPFVSYPYEWCPSALREAALLTLAIQKKAIGFGMALKDASAYNIQFRGTRPVFIDTLSFESYREGQPWVAYRQFCRHFLAPLALMSLVDVRLGSLLRTELDGIPLDLASSLLPRRSYFRLPLLLHLHLHGKMERGYGEASAPTRPGRFGKQALLGLIDSLESAVKSLKWDSPVTEWTGYETDTNYTEAAAQQKRRLVAEMLDQIRPRQVWDLGANLGDFSRLASQQGACTIAIDADAGCIERLFRNAAHGEDRAILPLHIDLTNPSSGSGWAGTERAPLWERGRPDALLALALVHHLAIGGNVSLPQIAELFARVAPWLVIEFVPKTDSQVGRLLVVREDVFADYHQEGFERAFRAHFDIVRAEPVLETARTVYLLRRKSQV